MSLLLIMHATSWSDKASAAKNSIQRLIDTGNYDPIVEVASSHPEAVAGRYLNHDGIVLAHDGMSPASLLRNMIFGDNPMFPDADHITLAGGILNASGGGCLNYAFHYLIRHCRKSSTPCSIHIPVAATYQAGEDGNWQSLTQVEQAIKDLVWKMLAVTVPFRLTIDSSPYGPQHANSIINLSIDTGRLAKAEE